MAQLPAISGSGSGSCIQAGWLAGRSSARQPCHSYQKRAIMLPLSIPQHRELAPGTLRALIRASGLSVEEFVALL